MTARIEGNEKILLELNRDVASARNPDALFRVVTDRLQPVLGFSDATVVAIDEKKNCWRLLLVASPTDRWEHEAFSSLFPEQPYRESPMEWLARKRKTTLETTAAKLERYQDFVPYHFLHDVGIRHSAHTPLRFQGRLVGMLNLHSDQEDFFQPEQVEFIEAVAAQLAIAAANIIADEQLRAKEKEKDALLRMSENNARVRNRDDLFRLMVEDVQPMVQFDDAVVIILTDQGRSVNHLLALPNRERREHDAYGAIMHKDLPIADTPLERFFQSKDDVEITSLEKLSADQPDYPGFVLMRETGLSHSVSFKLRAGGDVIGLLVFHYEHAPELSEGALTGYRKIANLIAMATANIMANEEILNREREKELLLDLSRAIASIQKTEDLYRVLFEKLQPIFDFNEYTGLIVYEDDETYRVMLSTDTEGVKHGTIDHDVIPIRVPIAGTSFSEVLTRESAYVADIGEAFEKYPDEIILKVALDLGLKQALVAPLRYQGRVIASLHLHYYETREIDAALMELLNSIADRLALAVGNLLADQAILAREQEKETLLEITRSTAQIMDRRGLRHALYEKLRPIFDFDDALILVRDGPDRLRYFIHGTPRDPEHLELIRDNAHRGIPIKGGAYEALYLRGLHEPFVFDFSEEFFERFTDSWDKQLARRIGYRQLVSAPLIRNDQVIGNLEFLSKTPAKFDTGVLPIFEAVARQIAVTVSNILANEELERRERQQSLRIGLTQELAAEGDWESRLEGVTRRILDHMPLDFAVFAFDQPDGHSAVHAYERLDSGEFRAYDLPRLFDRMGLDQNKFQSMRAQIEYEESVILNGAELRKHARARRLKQEVIRTFALKSNLVLPLSRSGAGGEFFLISLYSREEDAYRREHLDLLNRARGAMRTILERNFAYEEVALLKNRLEREKDYLMEEVNAGYNPDEAVGESEELEAVFRMVGQVAPTDTTVLVQGETGTGKELIARALHGRSRRADKPLVKVNCAALPRDLIESELFGHEKGAFTGAVQKRIGKFELAHESTIFLDEIGELPQDLQAKLLRALQEKEIERLGGRRVIHCDTRVIAATNRNLEAEVEKGNFRADLFYRLNVFPMRVPALRERRSDIPILAVHFAETYSRRLGRTFRGFAEGALDRLLSYDWPGNVRELQNIIEQATILAGGDKLNPLTPVSEVARVNMPAAPAAVSEAPPETDKSDLRSMRDALERAKILEALERSGGRVRGQAGAALLLGVKPSTLEYRMKKLGIGRKISVNVPN